MCVSFKRIITLTLIFCLLASALTMLSCKQQALAPVTVDLLKIGKADCIIINTGSKTVMIDTGESDNVAAIRAYMKARNYTKIDTLILTHYDKDHIGGAVEILANYGVTTVIEPHTTDVTAEYVTYHNAISALNVSLLKPTECYTFAYDDCTFTVDVPQKSRYKNKHDNNISLMISMQHGEKSFLFCGDAMESRLDEWINAGYGQHDFVKLPYHGNELDNYAAFLDVCKPNDTVITCSKKNPPADTVLSLLEQRGARVYLTYNGTVRAVSDGKSISVIQ